jgi:hypothetical protein
MLAFQPVGTVTRLQGFMQHAQMHKYSQPGGLQQNTCAHVFHNYSFFNNRNFMLLVRQNPGQCQPALPAEIMAICCFDMSLLLSIVDFLF